MKKNGILMAVWTRDSISPKGLLSWCLATVTETKVKAGAFAKKKKKKKKNFPSMCRYLQLK